jgi:PhzF family phenazine biosynthesis protein
MGARSRFFHIDAFTTRRFSGNPAAVMLMAAYPADAVLQMLAAENNLPETAFLVPDGGDYRLRWFTPVVEVPLCGHATLASAAAVMERLERDRKVVVFQTASGPLTVIRSGLGYRMDFPIRSCASIQMPRGLAAALGVEPCEVVWDGFNYLARLSAAEEVRNLAPDLAAVGRLDCAGVIVTAEDGGEYDFVSRYFAPRKGIPEDPVTGGAHCALTPFWAERLGRTSLRAFQASSRGGEICCELQGERVVLEGACVFYFEGEATF